jgi:hypothetical protein
LIESLKKVSYKIKDVKMQIKQIPNKATLEDFYQSDDNKLDLIYDLYDEHEDEDPDFEYNKEDKESYKFEYDYKEWYD